jgi:hypothetical protein
MVETGDGHGAATHSAVPADMSTSESRGADHAGAGLLAAVGTHSDDDAWCLPVAWCHDSPLHGRELPPDTWAAAPAGPSDRDLAAEGAGADDREWVEAQWALLASAEVARERLTEAATGHPGGAAAEALERSDPGTADATALLDGVLGLQRVVNWAQAVQQRYLAALARPGVALPLAELVEVAASPLGIAREIPDRDPAALLADPEWGPALNAAAIKIAAVEVGCALHLAPVTARSRTERAVTMVDFLPGTLAAQQSGGLDGYRASIIADRTGVLDPQQRRRVEDEVLPIIGDRAPSRVRELVDRHVNAIDPEAAARREEAARRGRGVRVDAGPDGMGSFRADIFAPHAQLAFGVLDHIAGTLQSTGLANGRGRNQLRADVFTDLFHSLATTGYASIDQPSRVPSSPVTNSVDNAELVGKGEGADRANAASGGEASKGDHHPGNSQASGGDHDPGNSQTSDGDRPGSNSQTGDRHGTPGDGQTTDRVDDHAESGGPNSAEAERPASEDAGRTADHGAACREWQLPICINVYVDATTLAGWDDEPAELTGHGVISASLARALAESASTIRAIAVHPPGGSPPATDLGSPRPGHSANPARARLCGSVLDVGRAAYRPPDRTADHVTTRDRICCIPGCRTRAERCDLDHRRSYRAGGASCPCNLDPLCRFHHLVKTFTRWHAVPADHGSLVWTSPLGRRYPTEGGHPLLDRRGGGVPRDGGRPPPAAAAPAQPAAGPDDQDPPPF